MHQEKNNTIGFLYSFGLIHLIKKGWQEQRVFIRESKDFLNWVDKVGALFLVSEPIPMSSANNSFRNLLLEMWTNWRRSALNVSLFFSKKPENLRNKSAIINCTEWISYCFHLLLFLLINGNIIYIKLRN